jgi:beta-lactamase class A
VGNIIVSELVLLLALLQPGSSLVPKFEQIASKARGRVGAAVQLIETGETAGIRMRERFKMASVFKLPIAMAVLHEIDGGKLSLEQKVAVKKSDLVPAGQASVIRDKHPEGDFEVSVRELLEAMMDISDGTACDVLLRIAGGPAAVTGYVRSLGMKDIEIAVSQKQLSSKTYEVNWASPEGILALLRILQESTAISRPNRDLLLQFMANSHTGSRRIKGLLPPETVVSHKTGTSGTVRGLVGAINDIGIINLSDGRHLSIAVFVVDARSGESACETVIAEIAKAAWNHYSGR